MELSLQIFLCYAREDEARVRELYRRLSNAGHRPWMDRNDLLPGEQWEHGIEESIRKADLFIACLSSSSVKKRGFIQREIAKALSILREKLDEDIYIIPLRLENCVIPESLTQLTWVDFFEDSGWEKLGKSIELAQKRKSESGAIVSEATPSHRLQWDVEIQRILSGEREDYVTRLGSVEEYINLTLSLSEQRRDAQIGLHRALGELIDKWSPTKDRSEQSDQYVVRLLDLIRSYTPVNGDQKILELLEEQALLKEDEIRTDNSGSVDDLGMKALLALERYYPVAFPTSAVAPHISAYASYIGVLRTTLMSSRYCSYAVRRLMELEEIHLDDQKIPDLLQRSPECTREIVSLLLNPARRSQLAHDLSQLYSICLRSTSDTQIQFERSLQALGGRLEHSNQGPIIVVDNDQMLNLYLPQSALDRYIQERWDREAKRGIEKLVAIMG